jgi:ABC-type transporter Mla MlaB component
MKRTLSLVRLCVVALSSGCDSEYSPGVKSVGFHIMTRLFAILAGVSVLIVVISWFRNEIRKLLQPGDFRRKERGAGELVKEGEYEEALVALSQLESHWELRDAQNQEYTLSDLRQLQRIVLMIDEACKASGRSISLQTIVDNLRDLIAIYDNRSSFSLFSGSLKPDKKNGVRRLRDSLNEERRILQQLGKNGFRS